MKNMLFILLAIIQVDSVQAQTISWQNNIGGTDSESLNAIIHTSDGGYVVGGYSLSDSSGDKTQNCIGSYDYWVVKLDSIGDIEWQKTIGGDALDILNTLVQTSDGGYILGGHSASGISGNKTEAAVGGYDYWVVKLDSNGNILWQNTIGGNGSDILYSIRQTPDGGYILGGSSQSTISGDKTEPGIGYEDFWLIKIDGNGTIIWQNTIGGNEADILFSLELTSDGGYVLGGSSKSGITGDKTEINNGGYDYWIVKTNAIGVIEWQNTIGGILDDKFHDISLTADGGYILGGESLSGISADKTEANLGSNDYWIVKIDSIGGIEWQNTIGGSNNDWLYCIKQTTDNGYILGGYSFSSISGDKTANSYGSTDFWVIKTDVNGNIQWQETLGGSGGDVLFAMDFTLDGNFILGGQSTSPISGIKTENSYGGYDYWVLKITNGLLSITEEPHLSNFEVKLYQNNENSILTVDIKGENNEPIAIEIYDNAGRVIKTLRNEMVIASSLIVKMDISYFKPGMYFVRVIGSGLSTKRFVKL